MRADSHHAIGLNDSDVILKFDFWVIVADNKKFERVRQRFKKFSNDVLPVLFSFRTRSRVNHK